MQPTKTNPQNFPLVQAKQARLLEACGFPCLSVGEHEFNGQMVEMWQATGEREQAKASLIGYGGAAYGGKSYGLLILARIAAELWPGIQIAYFRRTYPELDGPGASIQKAYGVFGDVAHDTDGGRQWQWDNGSLFFFRHCQNENDVYSYQSQQIDMLLIDEATHFTWFIIDYLLTRNRASGEIKVPGFRPFAVLPSNPGNIGHAWYSQVFDVDGPNAKPARLHETVKEVMNPNGKAASVYFIPAFLEDNAIGVSADPEYESRLMQRDSEIARALRRGDWKIFAGQAFPSWTKERIACKPFEIPAQWPKWRVMDYGFAHPMAAGWITINPQNKRVYIYRAVLATELSDTDQADMINLMSPPDERYAVNYASPDMWSRSAKKTGGRILTSVDEFREKGILLTRADDDRINGKHKIDRLLFDNAMDGKPMIQVFENYYDVFRCMETLVREDVLKGRNPEDVKKVDGDDAYDMLRYALTNLKQPAGDEGKKANTRQPGQGMRL